MAKTTFSGWIHSLHVSSDANVFLFLLAFRVFNATVLQTFFVPDEYWQSIEVAHQWVFGYGHLTWEWEYEIRSVLHPAFFALFYKIINLFGVDTPWLVAFGPLYVQSLLSAMTDYMGFKICMNAFGILTAKIYLVSCVSSYYLFYSSTRTLSNCMEGWLVILGVYFVERFVWLPPNQTKIPDIALIGYSSVTSASFFIRPTSVVVWFVISALWLIRWPTQRTLIDISRLTFYTGVFGIGFVLLDSYYYEHITFTPWNFYKVNVLHDTSSFYGIHNMFWYLTQGIPAVLGGLSPFYYASCLRLNRISVYNLMEILKTIVFMVVVVLSTVPHKEFRFLHGILHIILIISSYEISRHYQNNKTLITSLLSFNMILSLLIGLYLSVFDQRGPHNVMNYLRENTEIRDSVHFWTECHSTPYYTHVHRHLDMKFFDCTFIKYGAETESSRFLRSPYEFVTAMYTNEKDFPHYVVIYKKEANSLTKWFEKNNYHKVFEISHRWVEDPENSYMQIYSRKNTAEKFIPEHEEL